MDPELAMHLGQVKATALSDLKQDLVDAAVRYLGLGSSGSSRIWKGRRRADQRLTTHHHVRSSGARRPRPARMLRGDRLPGRTENKSVILRVLCTLDWALKH
jgi:hypothetical protein